MRKTEVYCDGPGCENHKPETNPKANWIEGGEWLGGAARVEIYLGHGDEYDPDMDRDWCSARCLFRYLAVKLNLALQPG
jgi:hypothetical protein